MIRSHALDAAYKPAKHADAQVELHQLLTREGAPPGSFSVDEIKFLCVHFNCSHRELLMMLLDFARIFSKPSISGYKVGAITQADSGKVYLGANIEFRNQSLPLCVHAEQSAFNNAWLNGEKGLALFAMSAAPCGFCRQFLAEITTAGKLVILVPAKAPTSLTELLPDAFTPRELGMDSALMEYTNNGLELASETDDPLWSAALDAANNCYAPYTSSYSGVALLLRDGQIVKGRYAENVAFNPSLPPMQSALANLIVKGKSYNDIVRAVIVEKNDAVANHSQMAKILLKSISKVNLEQGYVNEQAP